MDLNSLQDLKRLEEQIFQYKPNIKSAERKKHVSDRLKNQLLQSKAVVKVQRMDAECENLMISLKQRLMLLQDFLIPKNKELSPQKNKRALKDEGEIKLNLSSESSDDETLSVIMSKQKKDVSQNSKSQKDETTEKPSPEPALSQDNFLPLALRRQPRERRLSYKSYSSASTSHSRVNHRKICNKQEQTVTTSGVTFRSEEILLEQELDETPTLHIKIPSLHRGNVHYIVLDSINFARKVFDYRANEIREQQQKSILQGSTTSKSHKKSVKCSSTTPLQQLTHQDQESDLSQLIQDVMAEACNDETLQATNALENINNNLIDNYDPAENDSFINYSQSSHEFVFSQNSNAIDTSCSTSEGGKKIKKQRKNAKRPNDVKQNEPPRKRGRKPKQKTDFSIVEPQPPTKSNLAQYVEFFSNDCELLPGSTTPAASSTKSMPLVSSTTHNYEIADQLQQQQEQDTSQQPITYYIDGDWANGGPCQLISTNSVNVEGRQHNTNEAPPFQEFVNYIDNSGDSTNNVITTVLDCHSLPVSIPRSIANFALQNKNRPHQISHQTHQQPTVQNSCLPIINIQIPPLPNNLSSTEPPPAHTHKDVVDLSIKSKESFTSVAQETLRDFNSPCLEGDDECMPLDLSTCGRNAKEKLLENNFVTIDTQDEEFIRRLIEQSDFDYGPAELKKGNVNEISVYDNDNTKSFRAALDMPLLDFDASELARLVENTTSTENREKSSLEDNIVYNENNDDSNYVSMDAMNSSAANNLEFTDQSTTEIFNKLLDISPENNFLNDAFMTAEDLNGSVFDQCSTVENSTMCEAENLTQKNQREEEVCSLSSEEDKQEIGKNVSTDQPPYSTSSIVLLESSNNTTDTSLNLRFSSEHDSNELGEVFASPRVADRSDELYNKSPQCLPEPGKQFDSEIQDMTSVEVTSNETTNTNEAKYLNKHLVTEKTITKIKTDKEIELLKNDEKMENNLENHGTALNSNDIVKGCTDKQLSKTKDHNAEHQVGQNSKEKYQENVVFSVARITLSDDDNPYANDSDFSSGKSCDLNERKSIEKDQLSLNDFNLSNNKDEKLDVIEENDERKLFLGLKNLEDKKLQGTEDNAEQQAASSRDLIERKSIEMKNVSLDLSITETEKLPYVETNVDQGMTDSCKRANIVLQEEVESLQNLEEQNLSNTENSGSLDSNEAEVNNIASDLSNQNLTLLELESKLEGSLDFEEDFDDALSLATSCFDSPNDERFEDSIVDIDMKEETEKVKQQQKQQPENCSNASQIRDLKHFKIPKLNNQTDLCSAKVQDKPVSVEKNVCKTSPTNPSITQQPLLHNVGKITRTVKNDLVLHLYANSDKMLARNDLANDTTIEMKVLLKVFGVTCLPYLVDKCYDLTHCQLSHQLSDIEVAYQNLSALNKEYASVAYNILYNHSKLFEVYFKNFCFYYTNKNDRTKLLNMVNDCERYPEYIEFIIYIYEGLVTCGLSRVNACRLILKRIRETNISTSTVETLVAIIMKSDWTMFTDFIEKYTEDMYQFNFRIGTLEHMAPAVLNSKTSHLKQVFGKCVQTLHRDDTALLLNSPNLIQCVALLTTNT